MRTLGIDFGTRRVGLALSDQGGKLATPVRVFDVANSEQAIDLINSIIEKESVERLLVGAPLNMDGSAGPAARETIAWARRVAQRTGKPLIFVDERLSSFSAEQQLTVRKIAGERLTRARKKRQLDAVVAANLLQEFLDGRLPPLDIDRLI